MADRCVICYRPLNADSVPCPSCGCGRKVCPHHASRPAGEPTATKLYDLVKERRTERGHRTLTIPEINAVLHARADYVKATVDGPDPLAVLGELVDWLGAPGWDGPSLPVDLGKRIADVLAGVAAGPQATPAVPASIGERLRDGWSIATKTEFVGWWWHPTHGYERMTEAEVRVVEALNAAGVAAGPQATPAVPDSGQPTHGQQAGT